MSVCRVLSRREYMSDMVQPLDTLSDDELRALIAEAQAILRMRARKTPISEDPAIGMWVDREDMKDSAAWEREVRKREWRDVLDTRGKLRIWRYIPLISFWNNAWDQTIDNCSSGDATSVRRVSIEPP